MPFTRVVVGVDFSAASLAAARWVATELAPEAEIVLVHVLPEPEAPPFMRPYLPTMLDVVAEVAPALYGGLHGLAESLGAARTRIDMLTGAPADGLARAAEDVGADLVCLGRPRSRRGGARFGATTAQRLLARTRIPVLVVPAARPAPAKILAAVDGRPAAHAVVRQAWRLARSTDARVDALHVLGPELRGFVRACRESARGDEAAARAVLAIDGERGRRIRDEAHLFGLAHEWIARHLELLDAPPARTAAHVRVGDPGQEIVAFAHAAGADLIAIGRGDGAPAALAHGLLPLGSTTRLVMWAAPCPVLVLSPSGPTPPGPPRGRGVRRRAHAPPALEARAGARAIRAATDSLPPAAAVTVAPDPTADAA